MYIYIYIYIYGSSAGSSAGSLADFWAGSFGSSRSLELILMLTQPSWRSSGVAGWFLSLLFA